MSGENERLVVVIGEAEFSSSIADKINRNQVAAGIAAALTAQSKTSLGPAEKYYAAHPETLVTILHDRAFFENDVAGIVRQLNGLHQRVIVVAYPSKERPLSEVTKELRGLNVPAVFSESHSKHREDVEALVLKLLNRPNPSEHDAEASRPPEEKVKAVSRIQPATRARARSLEELTTSRSTDDDPDTADVPDDEDEDDSDPETTARPSPAEKPTVAPLWMFPTSLKTSPEPETEEEIPTPDVVEEATASESTVVKEEPAEKATQATSWPAFKLSAKRSTTAPPKLPKPATPKIRIEKAVLAVSKPAVSKPQESSTTEKGVVTMPQHHASHESPVLETATGKGAALEDILQDIGDAIEHHQVQIATSIAKLRNADQFLQEFGERIGVERQRIAAILESVPADTLLSPLSKPPAKIAQPVAPRPADSTPPDSTEEAASSADSGNGHTTAYQLSNGQEVTVAGNRENELFAALFKRSKKKAAIIPLEDLGVLLGSRHAVHQTVSILRKQLGGQMGEEALKECLVNIRGQGYRWDESSLAQRH